MEPDDFVAQPQSTRLQHLELCLARPGWTTIEDTYGMDEDIVPGTILLSGPSKVPATLRLEAWRIFCSKNVFITDLSGLKALLSRKENGGYAAYECLWSLKVMINVSKGCNSDPREVKESLEQLSKCHVLGKLVIELPGNGRNRRLIEKVIKEGIAPFATVLSFTVPGPIVVLYGFQKQKPGDPGPMTTIVSGPWQRSEEAQFRLLADHSARTEEDRRDRAMREAEADQERHDSSGRPCFHVVRVAI
ncbi:hypothetical protein LTR50_005655 [Elasticomyces elasticus]|nr:hypothetical protein LTR50_005655 [Elasticomyces elasticus]